MVGAAKSGRSARRAHICWVRAFWPMGNANLATFSDAVMKDGSSSAVEGILQAIVVRCAETASTSRMATVLSAPLAMRTARKDRGVRAPTPDCAHPRLWSHRPPWTSLLRPRRRKPWPYGYGYR